MRVLIAPDKFAGTLTAVEAADAIAEGWARQAPGDILDRCPMADGGPGFVDVLHAALGGEVLAVTVRGPFGAPVPATVLRVGETAYVESAQACGIHLTGRQRPEEASTYGVGALIRHAAGMGATRLVVGLGGSGTSDGGAGALAALGATAQRADGGAGSGPLEGGVIGLDGLTSIDTGPARAALAGVDLIAATDVDNPLTGLFGASRTYGPQKGVPEERLGAVDLLLERFAELVERRLSLEPGAGAAGGLGFALLVLGATRQSGIELVAEAVDLAGRARSADLVLTGEGAFDFSSRSGKVPYGVAEVAAGAVRPCVALAGQVLVGSREMRTLGIESAYSMVDLVGEQRSFADPRAALAELAARVARTWSPPPR